MDFGTRQRIEQFESEHGDFVNYGDFALFQDGATRERSSLGVMQPPPTDPLERAKLICKYWSIKLASAIAAFDKAKDKYLSPARAQLRSNSPGGPPFVASEVTAELEKLKSEVDYFRDQLEQAEAEAEKATVATRGSTSIEGECRQMLQEYIEEVQKINI